MKKPSILVLAAVSAAALVLVTGAADARLRLRSSDIPAPAQPSSGTLSVSGNAQVLVVPDQVEVRLGVTTRATELADAKADSDRRMKGVLERLRALNLPNRDLQTDALHVSPEYKNENGNPPRLVGYVVQRHLVLTLRDVSRFETVLQAAIEAGANEVMNIQFCSTELRKHRDQARQMAIRAAREKGELLTGELGMKLGRATQISEVGHDVAHSSYSYYSGGGYWSSRGSAYGMMQNSFAVAEGPNPQPEASNQAFAPGQIRISASVNVTFETR